MARLLARLLALLLVLFIAPVQGQEDPSGGSLVVILDGSGSMWGRLPGDIPRIVAAREALDALAGRLAGRTVGLVAYGHRRRGSCDDVATVVAPGPLEPAAFTAAVRGVNPLGMTPIARSIRHAAALLQPLEGPSTLLLITDGLENCREDPCATVRELKQAGADFTVQVVGLALGETDPQPLQCLAQAGGGRYLAVEEAADLTPALASLVGDTAAVEQPRAAVPAGETPAGEGATEAQTQTEAVDAPVPIPAPLTGSARLTVAVTLDGEPAAGEVTVFPADSRRRLARTLVRAGPGGNDHAFALEPGRYDLDISPRGLTGEFKRTLEDVAVAASGEQLTVNFESGTLTLGATVNGRPAEADIRVRPAGENRQLAWEPLYPRPLGNPRRLRLPPGSYDLEVSLGGVAGQPVRLLEGVEITPGVALERQIDFQAGELTLLVTVNGQPAPGDVTLTPAGGGERLLWQRIYNRAGDNPHTFLVPPGDYDLRVESPDLADRPVVELAGLTLGPGEVLERQADFPAGELVITTLAGDEPALADATLYPPGGQTRLAEARLYPRPGDNPHTFLLSPGDYDLQVDDPRGRMVERFNGIRVEAGGRVERTVRLPAR